MATILDYYAALVWVGLVVLAIRHVGKTKKRRAGKAELDSAQISKAFRR